MSNYMQSNAPMFCSNCGSRLVPGDAFCRGCGARVGDANPNKSRYDLAVSLMANGNFNDALAIFNELGGYEDAQAKAKECAKKKEEANKEMLYAAACDVLTGDYNDEMQFKRAIEALSTIPEYKDSAAKISELKDMLANWQKNQEQRAAEQKKKSYDTAVLYIENKLFEDALKVINTLGDYEGVEKLAQKCAKGIEEQKKSRLYESAAAVLTAERPTLQEIQASIQTFTDLADYKDSKNKIKEAEARLDRWYADKKAADEANMRMKAIAKAKKKKRNIIICACLAVILVTALVIGIVFATNEYAIDYNLDGGSVVGGNESDYSYITGDFTLSNPTKEGYTFLGWTGTDLSTPTLTVTIPRFSSGDRSYTANWQANTYNVVIDDVTPIYPEINITLDYNYGYLYPEVVTLENGDTFEYPEIPYRSDYAFTGWYTDPACANKYDFTGTITEDMTLYAGWYYISASNDYYYPWTISGNSLTSTNKSASSSSEYRITATTSMTVSFDYSTSSESGCDTLYIKKNGSTVYYTSGNSGTVYSGSVSLNYGDYISFIYSKDGTVDAGYDCAYITNLAITSDTTASNNLALNVDDGYISITNDYYYPWTVDGSSLTSTNKTSSSSSEYRITANISMTVSFDYSTSSESGCDVLYINKNGSTVYSASGTSGTVYSGSIDLNSGDYISFMYSKDGSVNNGNDCAYITNIVITSDSINLGSAVVDCGDSASYVYDDDSSASFDVTYGSDVTLPTPTRKDYRFLGWYYNGTLVESGNWDIANNATLTPAWELLTYYDVYFENTENNSTTVTVTFNNNYSGSLYSYDTLYHNETLSYPTVPTREGYSFVGWYLDADCTVPYSFSGTITEDITLYAKWAEMSSYYYSREYVDIANSGYSTYSKYFDVYSSNSSSQQYYYFTCYNAGTYNFEASRSTGDFYIKVHNQTQNTQVLARSNLYSGNTTTSTSFYANAGDVIYVSVYNYSSGTNSSGYFYVSNPGYPVSSAVAIPSLPDGLDYAAGYTYGTELAYGVEYTLPTPERYGYNFLGWYDQYGNLVEDGIWNYQESVYLTPEWEVIINTITFDANGGSVSQDSMYASYGEYISLPTPTREGYTFAGWSDGINTYNNSGYWYDIVDTELYAMWTANEYYVTFTDIAVVYANITVTFDYQYAGYTNYSTTLYNGQTLYYPSVPTRSGYVFSGWYTDSSFTTRFEFNSILTESITLYAKWTPMVSSSYNSRTYFDIANYTNSSYKASLSTNASSSSYTDYYYFTCYKTGSYTLYASYYSGDFYITVSNVTQGTTIMSRSNLYSSNPSKSATFSANAGDVICINMYNYGGSSSYSSARVYVTNAGYPTTCATADCDTIAGFTYSFGSTLYDYVTYDEEYELPVPTRTGYTFLGWYDVYGNRVEDGAWNIDSDITLYAYWY